CTIPSINIPNKNHMNILIEKKKFSEAVHTVARFAERSGATHPTLASILLIAGDDGIKLRATNLETAVDLKLDGKKKGDGVVAIPARILEQISSSFTGEGEITIEQTGDTILIKSGST